MTVNQEKPPAAKAWTSYWKAADHSQTGCLLGLSPALSELIDEPLKDFFARLPRNATVLDLGTGGGAVLKVARAQRDDLELTGVDYAEDLPSIDKNMKMMAGVRLEDLPFADNGFDAITSLFALEYAERAPAITELTRVLALDGSILVIAHHADSAIVSHNIDRCRALESMTAENGLLDQVIALVREGRQKDRSSLIELGDLLQGLRRKHPLQGVIDEVANLTARMTTDSDALDQLKALRVALNDEIDRLSAMQKASLSEAQAHDLASAIDDGCANNISATEISHDGGPLAWRISTPG